MEKSQAVDYTSIDYLEGLEADPQSVSAGSEILAEAARYHVDLDTLETVSDSRSDPVTGLATVVVSAAAPLQPAARPVYAPDAAEAAENIQENRFLDETDVRLRDMVNKVFRRSDRPFVIVRDDRIEYANRTFLNLLDIKSETDILKEKFLKLVAREDWEFLAENIGEMLINNEAMEIRLVTAGHKILKVKFDAMYLSDNQHFTFILIGERIIPKTVTAMGMYDPVTGLPNFYLFEDRVQVAVNYENYKDIRQRKNMIAVIGIGIDNFPALKTIGMHELVLQILAEKLMLSLRKTYTVASGLKYQFWILLPDVMDEESLKLELQKIQKIFEEPVADNFTEHDISASIGVSVFPEPGSSAKKLIEQTILSIQKAQKEGGRRMQIFGI